MKIKVCARKSKLSKVQVQEVMDQIDGDYTVDWIDTRGDFDLETSLELMDKTDFFTREIDKKVLNHDCDVGIHSAKDLPDPLPKGLQIIALTEGVDPRDSLVMREGERLDTLRKGAQIGASSFRRHQVIQGLRPDLRCIGIRGTVESRLDQLDRGQIDGLVVAEAALIRLKSTHRNRIVLPGKTASLQGQLAVVAREGDCAMQKRFRKLDSRRERKAVYLGLDPTRYGKAVFHFPLIETIPRPFHLPAIASAFADIPLYTHFIFTSQNGAMFFFDYLEKQGFSLKDVKEKKVLAIGKATASFIEKKGLPPTQVALKETQEGLIHLLALEDLEEAYLFLPQSSESRGTLSQALTRRGVRHQRFVLYDTQIKTPTEPLDLNDFEEIIFTSPSTVRAFKKNFGSIPRSKKIQAIGPLTELQLKIV